MSARLRRDLAAKSDGARYRQLTLDQAADGTLVLRVHEMGGSFAAPWGADDEEITAEIAPDHAARLAYVLLAERLNGRSDALRQLLDLCAANGIPVELANWT